MIKEAYTVKLVRRGQKRFREAEDALDAIWRSSRTRTLLRNITFSIKGYVDESSAATITGPAGRGGAIFYNSYFIKRLATMLRRQRVFLKRSLKGSSVAMALKRNGRDLAFRGLDSVSIFILTGCIANIILMIALENKIDTLGWIIRGGLILAGMTGLTAGVEWEKVKGTSVVLKYIRKNLK